MTPLKKGTVLGGRQPVRAVQDSLHEMFEHLVPLAEMGEQGLDLSNTPARVAKMYSEELLRSYKPGAYEDLVKRFTCFPSDGGDSMVLLGPTEFTSFCAHHMLPFEGQAYVGYIPDALIIGASKTSRVVEYYSHMLQIQERLCRQVADFIVEHAKPRLVVVLMQAAHSCMRCRGVRQPNVSMVTTAIRPDPSVFDESHRGAISEFYKQLELLRK